MLGFAFHVCLYFVMSFCNALYRYATTGSGGAGFDSGVLQAAFARK